MYDFMITLPRDSLTFTIHGFNSTSLSNMYSTTFKTILCQVINAICIQEIKKSITIKFYMAYIVLWSRISSPMEHRTVFALFVHTHVHVHIATNIYLYVCT